MPALIFSEIHASMTPSYSIADDREIIHFPLAGNGFWFLCRGDAVRMTSSGFGRDQEMGLEWDLVWFQISSIPKHRKYLDSWCFGASLRSSPKHQIRCLRFARHRILSFGSDVEFDFRMLDLDLMKPNLTWMWFRLSWMWLRFNYSHRTKIGLVLLWNHRTEWGGFKCRQTETKLRFADSTSIKRIFDGFWSHWNGFHLILVFWIFQHEKSRFVFGKPIVSRKC